MKPKIVETRKYSKLGSEQFRNDLQSMPFDEIKILQQILMKCEMKCVAVTGFSVWIRV